MGIHPATLPVRSGLAPRATPGCTPASWVLVHQLATQVGVVSRQVEQAVA